MNSPKGPPKLEPCEWLLPPSVGLPLGWLKALNLGFKSPGGAGFPGPRAQSRPQSRLHARAGPPGSARRVCLHLVDGTATFPSLATQPPPRITEFPSQPNRQTCPLCPLVTHSPLRFLSLTRQRKAPNLLLLFTNPTASVPPASETGPHCKGKNRPSPDHWPHSTPEVPSLCPPGRAAPRGWGSDSDKGHLAPSTSQRI